MKRWSMRVVAMIAVAAVMGTAGCSKKSPPPPPDVSTGEVVGVWLEKPTTAEPNPRMAPVERPTKQMRKLTLEESGTFTLVLADASGKASGGESLKGKWRTEGPMVIFEVTDNGLGAKYQDWATPVEYLGVDGSGELGLLHANGERVMYKRAS